jgi:acyl-CoA reductase-like NAD-dependent aldehyde dehydrogenase
MRDQRAAIEEIDRAIAEAKRAAIDDGKNIDDHPPVDVRIGWEGRFRKAMELLDHARGDLSFMETNMAAAPWRDAARANVERARGFVEKAMRDSWWR